MGLLGTSCRGVRRKGLSIVNAAYAACLCRTCGWLTAGGAVSAHVGDRRLPGLHWLLYGRGRTVLHDAALGGSRQRSVKSITTLLHVCTRKRAIYHLFLGSTVCLLRLAGDMTGRGVYCFVVVAGWCLGDTADGLAILPNALRPASSVSRARPRPAHVRAHAQLKTAGIPVLWEGPRQAKSQCFLRVYNPTICATAGMVQRHPFSLR